MVLTFEKKPLATALQTLAGLANNNSTMPILTNIMVTADEERGIEFTASDLQVFLRLKVEGTIEEEGSIAVLAGKLINLVNDLPDEEIRITTTANDRVEVECGRGKYRIIGLDAEEFPVMITESDGESIQIPGNVFVKTLERTGYAASTEQARSFLNGVYFNFAGDNRTDVVGTDGRQLSLVQYDGVDAPENLQDFIVTLSAVKELTKAFDGTDSVNIAMSDSTILFSDDTTVLSTRKIDGEYPKYEGIIPTEDKLEGRCVVNRNLLIKAINRVSHLANPTNNSVALDIHAEGEDATKDMLISTRTPELGDAQESVPVGEATQDIKIGFDSRILRDALNHIDSDDVVLEYGDELSPMIVRPRANTEHLILCMPMRLSTTTL